MTSKWAPDCTPCTPAWWLDYGCFGGPKCPPCSWTVPPCLPEPVSAPMNPYYPFAPYAPPYPAYGFDCNCGPPPPVWAPYQMPPNAPTNPLYAKRACPSIYVGGACCDECASGKVCAGAGACCDACAAGQGCSCSASPQALTAGPQVGALYVSDAELDVLGSQIALFDGDVRAAAQKEYLASDIAKQKADCLAVGFQWDDSMARCKNLPDWLPGTPAVGQPVVGPITSFLTSEWGPFDAKWAAYRGQTFHEPTSYDVLRTEFASLLGKWTGPMGQLTSAKVPEPLSANSGTNAIPWGWIALGGAIVALPFILPAITGAFLLATKGRGLGLGG